MTIFDSISTFSISLFVFTLAVCATAMLGALAWAGTQFLIALANDRRRESTISDLQHQEKVLVQRSSLQQIEHGVVAVGQLLASGKKEEASKEAENVDRVVAALRQANQSRNYRTY